MKGGPHRYFQSIPFKNSKTYHNFKFLDDIVEQSKDLDTGGYLFMPTK